MPGLNRHQLCVGLGRTRVSPSPGQLRLGVPLQPNSKSHNGCANEVSSPPLNSGLDGRKGIYDLRHYSRTNEGHNSLP